MLGFFKATDYCAISPNLHAITKEAKEEKNCDNLFSF